MSIIIFAFARRGAHITGICVVIFSLKKPYICMHKPYALTWTDPEGGQGLQTPTLKSHKNNNFLNNTGPDPLKNHKATKPAFIVIIYGGPANSGICFDSFLSKN